MPSIGIIGCGWLGRPLSTFLSKIYKVACYDKKSTLDTSSFWKSDVIIIAINTKNNYLKTLEKIATLSPTSRLILMSSTSVYREFDEAVNEQSLITKKGLQKEAEDLVQSLHKNVLILRLGGLMGDDRIAGKWKSVSTFSDGPVNYIHQEDVIKAVTFLIQKEIHNDVFNLVSPEHPLRSEVHKKNCEKFNLPLGTFTGETYRLVNSDKLIKLGYTFTHPNPLNFWDEIGT